ncbi:sulfur reduction protein DsrE [Corticibacter populi]|uniref:Sulfur reduction protein DsrE n=1 Tax=Corticibacter populi TaxID=1550736 RepID=A0A3M6R134_9BURK|nr:DsrE family protein [Corticibacter populi]RMX08921.1 sulfur reduction protein DsrE [Corticibacter populi]RZS35946.1 putative peroxiredoxin [Corticibacter populi]
MVTTADFVSTLFHGRSNPDKVTVALTMALNARLKSHTACLILMTEGVVLGLPGAADSMDIGQPFEPAADLLRKYLAEGGRVAVCKSCMLHNGLTAGQMDARFEIITAPDVIDLLMGARGSLQVA